MLNFSISQAPGEFEVPIKKPRTPRDPLSHRIIEKRRRDRMNNCLADLSQLIPPTYLKQGQGRIEKTEIIEMAIKHIKLLQAFRDEKKGTDGGERHCCQEKFYMGFKECIGEVMRFLVEEKGHNAADQICMDMMKHLQEQSEKYIPITRQEQMDQLIESEAMTRTNIKSTLEDQEKVLNYSQMDQDNERMLRLCNYGSSRPLTDQSHTGLSKEQSLKNLLSEKFSSALPTESEFSKVSGFLNACMDQDRGEAISGHEGSGSSCPSDINSNRIDRLSNESSKAAYKFKNTIKNRFHAGTTPVTLPNQTSDTVSDSSRDEEASPGVEMKQAKHNVSSPNSSDTTSTRYPGSEYSSSVHGSNGNGSRQSSTHGNSPSTVQASVDTDTSLTASVPAFALHPAGSYYIPIVIRASQLIPFLSSEHSTPTNVGICHPVSIPVSFGSPFVSMQNIHINSSRGMSEPFQPKTEPMSSSCGLPHHSRLLKRKWTKEERN